MQTRAFSCGGLQCREVTRANHTSLSNAERLCQLSRIKQGGLFRTRKEVQSQAACMIHHVHLLIMSVSKHFKQGAEVFRGKAIFCWLLPQILKAPGWGCGMFGLLLFTNSQLLPKVLCGLRESFHPAGMVSC